MRFTVAGPERGHADRTEIRECETMAPAVRDFKAESPRVLFGYPRWTNLFDLNSSGARARSRGKLIG